MGGSGSRGFGSGWGGGTWLGDSAEGVGALGAETNYVIKSVEGDSSGVIIGVVMVVLLIVVATVGAAVLYRKQQQKVKKIFSWCEFGGKIIFMETKSTSRPLGPSSPFHHSF